MKTQLLTVCLLATLAAGRAGSAPMPEDAVPPPAAQEREPESDIPQLEAEARQIDPAGRLTSDQLFALLQARESQRRADGQFDPTPLVVSISFFACLLMGFLAWTLANYRKTRQLHETVRLMVEKGVEIPQGLLAPAPRRPSDLRRGIILSATGLGLAIFLDMLPGATGTWGAGLTLFFIGVGHLIVWRLQQGRGPLSAALTSEPQP
jgi:hypothetical protein